MKKIATTVKSLLKIIAHKSYVNGFKSRFSKKAPTTDRKQEM